MRFGEIRNETAVNRTYPEFQGQQRGIMRVNFNTGTREILT
jgi:hypothetical protein